MTQSGLPSFDWTPRGTGALVPAVALCTHQPPWALQTNLGKSPGSQISRIGCDSEFYLAVEQVTCPLLGGQILGGARVKHQGISTHGLDTEWGSVERY